jgi:hypothetical protein
MNAREPHTGKYALVIAYLINGYEFSEFLMDAGISINILYIETLHRMQLSEAHVKQSNMVFHTVFSRGYKHVPLDI